MVSRYLFNFTESMDWEKRQIRLILESATNIGVDPDLGQSLQTSPAVVTVVPLVGLLGALSAGLLLQSPGWGVEGSDLTFRILRGLLYHQSTVEMLHLSKGDGPDVTSWGLGAGCWIWPSEVFLHSQQSGSFIYFKNVNQHERK